MLLARACIRLGVALIVAALVMRGWWRDRMEGSEWR